MKLAALLTALLFACGPKSAPVEPDPAGGGAGTAEAAPAGVDPEIEALAVQGFELLEALAGAAEAGAGDCAVISDNMNAVADGPNGGAIHAADADPRMTKDVAEQLFQKHGARFDAAIRRLEAALGACQNEPGIDAALQKVGLGPAAQ